MNKQYAVISCPIDTYSGYGSRSRDFVKALFELKKDEWDFHIVPQRWGNTPWGYIEDNKEEWGWLKPLIYQSNQLQKKPDFWCQITVPNEFQPIGKYNLGVTAGIETTVCDPSWIEGCNRMDLTLVSSNHSKTVLESNVFTQIDQKTQAKTGELKLNKPVQVLFEGVDTKKYYHKPDDSIDGTDLVITLDSIEEDFCFLFVGHWLPGDIGEDRKNVGLAVKTFLETFKGKKKKPALILKTSTGVPGVMDVEEIKKRLDSIRKSVGKKDLPNVYVINGDLKDEDINDLYNHYKVKAMYNLTKGEGFGRPLLEFTQAKKPIITSYWSGQVDFLEPDYICPIIGELKPIHSSAVMKGLLVEGSTWFSPDISVVKKTLYDVHENYDKYIPNAKRQARKCQIEFSYEQMKEKLKEYTDKVPKQVQIQLPKLQLPKLKKIE